ncbi:putative disease resistance protein RGA4 [Corylus avellana]|uniref:putative disease resistance protein RGA4 n=1 Tax=Corylus avellana TaxID=13451 RepID=UPI00286A8664|nr:putative disease resistance protein RGA4 [Corylus avellana]
MAELVIFNIAGSIGKSLGFLALQEIGLLWSFKDELRKLGNTVSTIQAVLSDAEEKQAQNRAVRDWLEKLKDAMYEADDLLDDYSTKLLRRQVMTQDKKAKQVRIFFSKSNQLGYGLQMSHRIKAIRKRLHEIAADRWTFGLVERPIATQPPEHRKREDTHSFVLNEDVIGRNDEKKDVKELLLDSNMEENVSIIPIVGIGGLGKTTLAKYVFNDEHVQRHFDLKVWVCVSDPFDVKTIVQKLIESTTKKIPESFEMDALQSELRVIIGGKRFLLILDDVWNENRDKWLNLKTLLVGGLRGSKVLITTRSMKVAKITVFPKDYEIQVQELIKLWISQGFVHSSDRNRCLEDVGHEYFMDLLWGSFFQEPHRNAYGDIKSCKMHDLIHDFAQSVAENECIILNPNAEEIVEKTRYVAFDRVYSFSDIQAPLLKANKMRTLLLQLPIVNRDFEVLAGWNKSIIDTLVSSFKCLRALNLSCSNIQEVPNSIGKLKHLRFLDLSWNGGIKLLPTSITKLQNLQTLNLDYCSGLTELPEDMSNLISLRHLEIYGCSLSHMPHGLKKLTALQTLSHYILGKKESHVFKPKGGLSELYGLNELRRSLCIKGLEHLRSYPVEAKATNLERKRYLQHLGLRWDPEADDDIDKAIANDEQLLQNFRPHLNLKSILIDGYAGVELSSWVSSLSNLVFLSIWSCRWCQHIPPLNQFPFLKYLHLSKLSALEYIGNDDSDVSSSSLQSIRLQNLPKLKGWWRMIETVTAEYEPHHHFPLFPSFPCLTYLNIKNCSTMSLIPVISPSSSSPFSDFSNLKSLFLNGLEELEYLPEEWLQNLTSLETVDWGVCNEDEEGIQCFGPTRLRHLYINNVANLVSLPRELRHATTLQWLDIGDCPILMSLPEWIGDFTSLQTLQILNCPNLISMPEGMLRLTSLRYLTIVRCPHLEERCQEGIGEDWQKIAHIPNFPIEPLYYKWESD